MRADVPVPLPDPLADLPPTARRIVETTRRLLVEKGYSSLSLETISQACSLNKTAIRYYFQNKAGLMEVVVDTWVHDNISLLLPLFTAPPGKGLLHAFLQAKEQMSENTQMYLALFELLPAILRDKRHSEQITHLYEWAMEMYGGVLETTVPGMSPQEMRGFTQLVIALVDGLGIQYAINQEKFQTAGAFDMWESIIDAWTGARRSADTTPADSEASACASTD